MQKKIKKIGVDATVWQNQRGFGRLARSLLTPLVELDRNHEYIFFYDNPDGDIEFPPDARIQQVSSSKPTVQAAGAAGQRALGDMWRMSQALSDASLDLVLFPTVYSFVPVFSRAKVLLMIQDITAEKFPQYIFPNLRSRINWMLKSYVSRRQADAIVTISDYAREEILEFFKLPADKVFIVDLASDPIFRKVGSPKIDSHITQDGDIGTGRRITYLGGFGPHKNVEMLIRVFAQLIARSEFQDLILLLVGENQKEIYYSEIEKIRSEIARLEIVDRVKFTGFLPDEVIVQLLNLSTVLVLPSFMEGFGLPAIEAAACGCPVIATTESPLPGLLGEGALYVSPYQPAELEQAMIRVLNDPDLRDRMSAAGLAAAQKLSWENSAKQLCEVIDMLI